MFRSEGSYAGTTDVVRVHVLNVLGIWGIIFRSEGSYAGTTDVEAIKSKS